MRKLTRRSYNRKLIVFGLVLLMAIGMISTGFAAWVMSSVNNADVDAGVTVGTISDASMTVTVDQWRKEGEDTTEKWYGDILSFDARNGDNEGRIRADGTDADEQLTVEITGKVTNVAALGDLTLSIKLPESLAAAIDAKYIALSLGTGTSESYNADTDTLTVSKADLNFATSGADGTFSYTLTFVWGSYFGGVNPCDFYDSDVAKRDDVIGDTIGDAEMQNEMRTFRTTITGSESNDVYTGTLEITVTATTN